MFIRYLVFGYREYYPCGGFNDFIEEVSSEEEFSLDKYKDRGYDCIDLVKMSDTGHVLLQEWAKKRNGEWYRCNEG